MSEAHSSSPPRDLRTDEHVEGSDPAATTGGSSDDAATLSYNAFEPTLQATQDLATGHVTQELNVGGDPAEWSGSAEAIHAKGNGTASHSLSSLLSGSGSEENRQKVATQPVINAAGAFWHGTDHYISQGSTLTTTSKEYYSSSDISQRSQASILHNVQYHSPLEQLQQRRGQQLVVPHSRPELVSEPSIGAWSDPEHTPELARQSPTEALWSTRGHFSSSSESNMSPPTTARIIGREVSSLSNLSSHSHYSERSTEHSEDATPPRRSNTTSTNRILDREISSLSTLSSRTHYSEQSTNHTAAQVTPLRPSSTPSDGHVVNSSQGSIPQESFETRPEPPQTPAARKPMYVQGTFADELTPEMLKQAEEDIVWSSSPSKRAAERHRQGRRLEASPVSPLTRATLQRWVIACCVRSNLYGIFNQTVIFCIALFPFLYFTLIDNPAACRHLPKWYYGLHHDRAAANIPYYLQGWKLGHHSHG